MSPDNKSGGGRLEEVLGERPKQPFGDGEDRLVSILNAMSDGVVVVDGSRNLMFWNPAAATMLGLVPEDLHSEAWALRYGYFEADGETPTSIDRLPLARSIKGERIENAEFFLRHPERPNGLWLSTSTIPLRAADGSAAGAMAIFHDITVRVRTEQILRENEERFRDIIETAHEAFVSINADGLVTAWNPEAERIFGWSEAAAIGQKLAELIIPIQHREAHKRGLAHYLDTGEGPILNKRLELTALHHDGREFPIEFTVSATRIGETHAFNAFIRDITERKQAERDLLIMNEDLRRESYRVAAANRELESFAYTVSHDLRSPLTVIDGFAGMMLDEREEALPADAKRLLGRIRLATGEMNDLIDRLLDFSRLGQQQLKTRTVDMVELTHRAWADQRALAKDRQVVFSVAQDLPPCQADPDLLNIALANLLSNAIKYSRNRDPAEISVGFTTIRDSTPAYFVSDNGIGFDMSFAGRLFGPFERLHRDDEFEGTGIGLATVQRIIERHGGRVWAEGEPGHGATFYFTLEPPAGSE